MEMNNHLQRHLIQNNQTYFQHMKTSFGFALHSLMASACFCVHGMFPFIFETTGSAAIANLNSKLKLRTKDEDIKVLSLN